MKFLSKLAPVLGLLLTLTACVPVIESHYILNFEKVPKIQVTERRRLDVDEIFFNLVIPVRYVLEREEYVLHFEVSENTFWSMSA